MKPAGMHWGYWVGWQSSRLIAKGYFGWRALHPERLPLHGPCLVAANHACFFDPFFVGAGTTREMYYLARASAFWFPLGAMLRRFNAIPMDRESGGLKGMLRIIDIINQGHAITLFPEGTRTADGQLQPAKAGVGLIAIKSAGPVVPVRIFGSYEAWNRHMTFPRPRRRVTVKYGHPLDFSALRAEAADCSKPRLKAIYQEVSDAIMRAIASLEPHEDPA